MKRFYLQRTEDGVVAQARLGIPDNRLCWTYSCYNNEGWVRSIDVPQYCFWLGPGAMLPMGVDVEGRSADQVRGAVNEIVDDMPDGAMGVFYRGGLWVLPCSDGPPVFTISMGFLWHPKQEALTWNTDTYCEWTPTENLQDLWRRIPYLAHPRCKIPA